MITIYGKASCGFCTKAKAFADQHKFNYEYKDVGISKDTLFELMDRAPIKVKTVPQIFIGKDYIGGYNEFTKYVKETGYNGTEETL